MSKSEWYPSQTFRGQLASITFFACAVLGWLFPFFLDFISTNCLQHFELVADPYQMYLMLFFAWDLVFAFYFWTILASSRQMFIGKPMSLHQMFAQVPLFMSFVTLIFGVCLVLINNSLPLINHYWTVVEQQFNGSLELIVRMGGLCVLSGLVFIITCWVCDHVFFWVNFRYVAPASKE